jgi:hypothetical protein
MLCVYPGPPQDFIDGLQQSSEVNKVILCTSSQLAECKKDEIETIIQRAMDVVSVIEHAEEAGWFFLSEAGELQDILHPIRSPFHLRSVFEDGLKRLPWCLAQLNAGEAVLVPSLDNQRCSRSFHCTCRIKPCFVQTNGSDSAVYLSRDGVVRWDR